MYKYKARQESSSSDSGSEPAESSESLVCCLWLVGRCNRRTHHVHPTRHDLWLVHEDREGVMCGFGTSCKYHHYRRSEGFGKKVVLQKARAALRQSPEGMFSGMLGAHLLKVCPEEYKAMSRRASGSKAVGLCSILNSALDIGMTKYGDEKWYWLKDQPKEDKLATFTKRRMSSSKNMIQVASTSQSSSDEESSADSEDRMAMKMGLSESLQYTQASSAQSAEVSCIFCNDTGWKSRFTICSNPACGACSKASAFGDSGDKVLASPTLTQERRYCSAAKAWYTFNEFMEWGPDFIGGPDKAIEHWETKMWPEDEEAAPEPAAPQSSVLNSYAEPAPSEKDDLQLGLSPAADTSLPGRWRPPPPSEQCPPAPSSGGSPRPVPSPLIGQEPTNNIEISGGTAVRIHGLQTQAHLNGCCGLCEEWLADSHRWVVRLKTGKGVKVKTDNLEVCQEENNQAGDHAASDYASGEAGQGHDQNTGDSEGNTTKTHDAHMFQDESPVQAVGASCGRDRAVDVSESKGEEELGYENGSSGSEFEYFAEQPNRAKAAKSWVGHVKRNPYLLKASRSQQCEAYGSLNIGCNISFGEIAYHLRRSRRLRRYGLWAESSASYSQEDEIYSYNGLAGSEQTSATRTRLDNTGDAGVSKGEDVWFSGPDPWSKPKDIVTDATASSTQEASIAVPHSRSQNQTGWESFHANARSNSQGHGTAKTAKGSGCDSLKRCALCHQESDTGTWDWLSRRDWRCKQCCFEALQNYRDTDLARHLKFMLEHAPENVDAVHTHNSFLGFNDPTCFCGKLHIPPNDEDAMKQYCEAVAFFHSRSRPVFHMEVIGKDARVYCEDLDVLCPQGRPAVEHVLSDKFLSLRLLVMSKIFPEIVSLQVHIYTSSGIALKYNHWKTSVHLVWEGIIVDERRAAIIRQHCVESLEILSECPSGEFAGEFPEDLREVAKEINTHHLSMHAANTWDKVFDRSVAVGGNGLRVPLSDKKDKPLAGQQHIGQENRSKLPVGTWQLNVFGKAECVMMRHHGGDAEWVRKGLCSCPSATPLSEWVEPALLNPLESRQERYRRTGSGSNADSAAGTRKTEIVSASSRDWEMPETCHGANELVVMWSDGSRGEHGIAGAATVSLLRNGPVATDLPHSEPEAPPPSSSQILFEGYLYIPGKFTPACSEYLGFLLGLRQISEHIEVLRGRQLVLLGDSRAVQRHQMGLAPAADAEHLVPLAKCGQDLIAKTRDITSLTTQIQVVERHKLSREDKSAKYSLRTQTSSLEDHYLPSLFKQSEEIWKFGSSRTMTANDFLKGLGQSQPVAQPSTVSTPPQNIARPDRLESTSRAVGLPSSDQAPKPEHSKSLAPKVSAHSDRSMVQLKLQIGFNCPFIVAVPRTMTARDLTKEFAGEVRDCHAGVFVDPSQQLYISQCSTMGQVVDTYGHPNQPLTVFFSQIARPSSIYPAPSRTWSDVLPMLSQSHAAVPHDCGYDLVD